VAIRHHAPHGFSDCSIGRDARGLSANRDQAPANGVGPLGIVEKSHFRICLGRGRGGDSARPLGDRAREARR
jgi:hypothetical protein